MLYPAGPGTRSCEALRPLRVIGAQDLAVRTAFPGRPRAGREAAG
ncbi:hypothetical protein [Actinomadura macrotermitis]|nr:hypothetical protein [Actinomadura macrotermitis]